MNSKKITKAFSIIFIFLFVQFLTSCGNKKGEVLVWLAYNYKGELIDTIYFNRNIQFKNDTVIETNDYGSLIETYTFCKTKKYFRYDGLKDGSNPILSYINTVKINNNFVDKYLLDCIHTKGDTRILYRTDLSGCFYIYYKDWGNYILLSSLNVECEFIRKNNLDCKECAP